MDVLEDFDEDKEASMKKIGELTCSTVKRRAFSVSGYGTICVICLVDLSAPAEKEE